MDSGAREYARTGRNSGLPKRVAIMNVSHVPLDPDALAAAVSARIYEAVALSDMYGLGKAEKYVQSYGSLRGIKKEVVIDDFDLGWWVVRQRIKLRENKIDAVIKERLDELGIAWDPFGEIWANVYASLRAWIQKENGRSAANVPRRLKLDGVGIGIWLQIQRQAYWGNKLSQERTAALESIGIEWRPHDAKWQKAIAACQQWCAQDRDLSSVSHDSTVDGYPLGTFISHQRQFFKKVQVTEDRIKQLEEMGMVWDKKDATWMMNFHECKHYVAHVGAISQVNANGPPYRGVAIGRWLHHQRQLAKKGKLREDRKALLDAIGMNWVPDKQKATKKKAPDDFVRWKAMLAICDEYVESHPGRGIQAGTKSKGKRIGDWLRNNLYALRKGDLAPERAVLLEPRIATYRYKAHRGK
jgi:hypothetical protein